MELPETRRLVKLSETVETNVTKKPKLMSNVAAFRGTMARSHVAHKAGMNRLVRFLNLLGEYDQAKWASMNFDLNAAMIRRFVQTHLPIIVGEYYNDEKASLEALCNSPDRCKNVVWITNRQQGKTTTLSKFLAALMVLAPIDGMLCCIYSTNYDRATELLKGAKMYLNSMAKNHPFKPKIISNNERSITLKTIDGYTHTVSARPRNPNSCRGDAPKAAIFDEIAFVSEDFW